MQDPKTPRFDDIEIRDVITETALALAGVKDESWIPIGTCVLIGANLAITARHVIKDFLSEFGRLKIFRGSWEVSESIIARQILQEGESKRYLHVKRVWFSPFTDVALLHLIEKGNEKNHYDWKPCAVQVTAPSVGSRIVGFGYHSSSISVSPNGDDLEWEHSPSATVGEVVEIFPKQRDSVMLPFPCYRTNARFERGMSGGPVFNEDGHLCGLICDSMKGAVDEPYVSHVVTLWPSLGTYVDVAFKENPAGELVLLYDLAKFGYVSVIDLKQVVLGVSSNGEPTIGC